jgi:predicted metalloprotease with PDZ domain
LVSALVSNITYDVAFDRARGRERTIHVTTRFTASGGRDPILLSLPAWTPGAYELSNFARFIVSFEAKGDGKALDWDKLDYDTWRVMPNGARNVVISFDYRADTLDNAMAWSRDDFAFFNGTNLFLYPEGRDAAFAATVTITTEKEWKITTGMAAAGAPRTFTASNYHDLVDMPFFVGEFDVDSQLVADKWIRLASYPAHALAGAERGTLWKQLQRMIPPLIAVTTDVPFDTYTVLTLFDSTSQGGSALEHSNSHFGIYSPFIIGNTALPSIVAHEIFHAWNVKRMRPAEMVPYRYDRAQPTPWLWVSEGITDYYADLALVRGGIVDSAGFIELTNGKIEEVRAAPPIALEDASLSTWIHPVDGTGYIYYPKGSLAGFLLDVMIRDATDNRRSLDDVMAQVYTESYKRGKGFTNADWWRVVTQVAGGKSFADFSERYIDGREPFPWEATLALAGVRLVNDTIREPRLGISTVPGETGGIVVSAVDPTSSAGEAGLREGDVLVSIGNIPIEDQTFGQRFRQQFGSREGAPLEIKVKRGEQDLTLQTRVRMAARVETRMEAVPGASAKAAKIRSGILRGTVGN